MREYIYEIIPEDKDEKCFYCGSKAFFYVGRKKNPCCSDRHTKCPELRRKNAEGLIKAHSKKEKWTSKKRISWSKGLTKETSEILRKRGETLKKHIKEGKVIPYFKGKKHSEETRKKWKLNPNMGGLRKGSGRGIKGIYQGYYCDSTWELAWLIYQLDHNKIPIRNTESFLYTYKNETHRYYPDFILDDIYYEIKGQKGESWEAKLAQFPKDKKIIVLDKTNIREYIEYAEFKFGKDYWIATYGDTINKRIEYKKHKNMDLCVCGNKKRVESKFCIICSHKKQYKVDWDSIDLETIMKENNYNKVAVGKILGVSDNAVKKHYNK